MRCRYIASIRNDRANLIVYTIDLLDFVLINVSCGTLLSYFH